MNNKRNPVIIQMLIMIAVIIMANLVAINWFVRFDLTKNKIYSLTKASKKSVQDLEDRLVIKAYFSDNLPPQLADAKTFTLDLLSEYQAYSQGNLVFEFINPKDEEDLKVEAQKNKIQPFTMRVPEKDKLEIREVYLGLAFLYQDKTETIPLVQTTRGLEYDITSTIKRISSQNIEKVAFFEIKKTPPVPVDPRNPEDYQSVKRFLSANFELVPTDLEKRIDDNISVLIFPGVSDSLSTQQILILDQYLMGGGRIMFFQDRVRADLQTQTCELLDSNIFTLLKAWGINIKENVVSDASCGQINVQERRGIFTVNSPIQYPFFPIVRKLNTEHPITTNLELVQLIFGSELDLSALSDSLSFTPLLSSSDHSGEVTPPKMDISYMPYKGKNLTAMLNAPAKILGGLYEGQFKSYFKKIPGKEYPDRQLKQVNNAGKILLVADTDFIKEGAGIGVPGNMNFLQNAIDYLAGDADLIELRSRETTPRLIPVEEIKPAVRNTVKWLNILLPSLLLVIFGFIYYQRELAKRKRIKEYYEK